MALAGMTGRHCFPIHGFTDFQELYQSNHGTAGNPEAGGFVNSAVKMPHRFCHSASWVVYTMLGQVILPFPESIPMPIGFFSFSGFKIR